MPSGDDKQELEFGLRTAAKEQKLFGRYTLKRVLGRGGMGIVWLAHDDELIRYVAMKFLPDMLVRDREAVEDLKRETRRSLDLTHHHIVRIYDFTQDEMCAAIIMEFVDGETLSAMKSQQAGGCFGVSVAAPWVGHFASALDYAHRQARVIHRDLKPANLMINSRGDLKITDFGISRSMSDSMTRVSVSNTAGTLAYMSPEQALGAPPMPGDDIYAFGATVYDLLTGRPPFFRGNLQVQLETVIPPRMEDRRAELGNSAEPIPELWQEVIAACLAKRPQDRPQTIAEVSDMLGLSGTASSLRPTTSTGSTTSGTTGTARTRAHATEDAATDQQAGGSTPGTARPPSRPSNAPRPTGLDDILAAPSVRDERPIVPDQARVTAKPTQGTGIAQTIPPEDLTISGQKASEFTDAPVVPPVEESSADVASSPASFPGGPLSTPERKSSPGLAIAALVSLVVVGGAVAWMFLKPEEPKPSAPATTATTTTIIPATPVAPVAKVEPKVEPVVVPPAPPPPSYESEIAQIWKFIAEEKVAEANAAIGKLPPDLASIGELKTAVLKKQSDMKAAEDKAASEAKMAKQTIEIAKLMADAKTKFESKDFDAARSPLQRILSDYGDDQEAKDNANKQLVLIGEAENKMVEDNALATTLEASEALMKAGEFSKAEEILKDVPSGRKDDPAVAKLKEDIGEARTAAMNRQKTAQKSSGTSSRNKSSGGGSSSGSGTSRPPAKKPEPQPVSRPVAQPKPVIIQKLPPKPSNKTPFKGGGVPGG